MTSVDDAVPPKSKTIRTQKSPKSPTNLQLTSCVDFVGDDCLVDSVGDGVRMLVVSQVVQHVNGSVQHGEGIGDVLSSDGTASVSGSRLENGEVVAVVASRQETSASDEPADDVRGDGAVEVGGQQDVELMGVGDELVGGLSIEVRANLSQTHLHASVVDDHVVVLDVGVVFGDAARSFEEAAVREFHDVGLVDGGDLLAVVSAGELKGVAAETLGIFDGDDLHRLDDSLHALVFQHRVFAFCVLADDDQVDILVVGANTRVGFAVEDVDEQVKLVSQGDVTRHDAELLGLCLDVSLDGDAVTLDGGDGVFEVVVGLAVGVDVNHLEVDWHASIAEDLSHVVHELRADSAT